MMGFSSTDTTPVLPARGVSDLHARIVDVLGYGVVSSVQAREAGVLEWDLFTLVAADLAKIELVDVAHNFTSYRIFF